MIRINLLAVDRGPVKKTRGAAVVTAAQRVTIAAALILLSTLVAVGWGTFQAGWLWLWFSLERTNARATRRAASSSSASATRCSAATYTRQSTSRRGS